MFGPNTLGSFYYESTYSHRCEEFKKLYGELTALMKEKFNLHQYDILFIPGSGTFGVECLIKSSNISIEIIGNEGKFKDRWKNLNDTIQSSDRNEEKKIQMFCQLETSNSSVFSKEECFVDAISSFPFYQIPKKTKAFVCCSNKQIGAFPGLSIVFVKKDCWDLFREEELFSIMNLSLYRKHSLNNQLPTTAPVQIFQHLLDRVKSLDISALKSKIISNSNKITSVFDKSAIVGETISPVITIKKEFVPLQLAKKFKIYHYNNDYPFYQIFTYSTEDRVYDEFIREVKKWQ